MVDPAQANNNSLFSCTARDCKKIFQRKSDLTRHQKIHASSKLKAEMSTYCPYPGCDHSSLQRYNIETHLRTHEKDKFHPCPHIAECMFASTHAADLINHYETIHNATAGQVRVKATLAAPQGPDSVASAMAQSLRTKDPRVRPAPYPSRPAVGYSSHSYGKAQAIFQGVQSSLSHNLPSFPPFSTNSCDGPIIPRMFNITQTPTQLSLPAHRTQDQGQFPKLLLSHGWISPGKLTQESLTGNESYNMIRCRFIWACHHYYGPGSPYSDYLKTRPSIPKKMRPASGVPGQMQMELNLDFDAEGANLLAYLPVDRWFEEWRFSMIENNPEQSEVAPGPSAIAQQVSSSSSNIAPSIRRSTNLPVIEQQVAEHTNLSSSSTSAAFQPTPSQMSLTNIGGISKEVDIFSMNPSLELSTNLDTSTVDWEGLGLENV